MSNVLAKHSRPFSVLPVLYALMLVVTAGGFLAIRHYGETFLTAPAPTSEATFGAGMAPAAHDELFHVLLAMATVIAAGRLLGFLFRSLRQPPVIGEVVAGILLGPTLLGWLWPQASEFLLPTSAAPFLKIIAQLGVILYMFLVGLELNTDLLRERGHATIAISHASIVVPFTLGGGLAVIAYPRLGTSDVPFTVFALFLGVSLSVTAFPVLARILTDRNLSRTSLGVIALTCAATDDVTAWLLLAFVVGVAQAKLGGALLTIALAIAFIALMMLVVRPVLSRLLSGSLSEENLSKGTVAMVFLGLLLSAVATEAIGIHAIFGAFLFGAVIPHDSRLAREFIQNLQDVVAVLLLPAFFAFTGMRTQIGLVQGWENILFCGLIILLATMGKFLGSAGAARLTGLNWRTSAAVGILMNTRGLMELIVLNIGLDLKVISPTLFAMLVLMAVVTTMMTSPILDLLVAPSSSERRDELETAPLR